ncbi:MAG: hypothetical protein ACPG4Z_04640 [Chitinophagales bacterium]
MKKVLLMMLAFATISFTLVSCSEDDGTTPAVCEACGTYNGNFNTNGQTATILIPDSDTTAIGLDNEVLEDTPFSAVVTEGSTSSELNMLVTLQVEVSGVGIPVPVDVVVNYDADAGTFAATPNEDYDISVLNGAINISAKLVSMEGTITNNTTVAGTIVLDDPTGATVDNIDATFVFNASK